MRQQDGRFTATALERELHVRVAEVRAQLQTLATSLEHVIDVVEACMEASEHRDRRVDVHLEEARRHLGRVW